MTTTTLFDSYALQINIPGFLQETIAGLVAFVPRLLAALVILVIGWIIGRIVAAVIRRGGDAANLDRHAQGTPVGNLGGGGLTGVLGKIAAYYVYAIAILTAANALSIPILSQWIARAVSFLPAIIAGVLIVLLGFIVADFVADAIERSGTARQTEYAGVFATGVRFFLYFTVITIGLDTMGIDTQLLYVFARAIAYGLAAALAIALGLAFGLGGRRHVDENVGEWIGRANQGRPSLSESSSESGSDPEISGTDD